VGCQGIAAFYLTRNRAAKVALFFNSAKFELEIFYSSFK